MTEVSTRPQVGATKAPARPKKAPSPAPVAAQTNQDDDQTRAINDDEMAVAAAAHEQLQACYDAHWSDMTIYGAELLCLATSLMGVSERRGEADIGDAFHSAAAAVSGTLAIERAKNPGRPAIAAMEQVFLILDSAAISFSSYQNPCEALAVGIRAGAQAPLAPRMGNSGYSAAQLRVVLGFVAGTANTLNNVLLMAQTCEEDWERARLVDAAQAIAQHIGAAADGAVGGTVIGNADRWNYGPSFALKGKAGAA